MKKRGPKPVSEDGHILSQQERNIRFQTNQRKKELMAIERREKRSTFKRSDAEWLIIDSEIKQREPMTTADLDALFESNPEQGQAQLDYEWCAYFNISFLPESTRTHRIFDCIVAEMLDRYGYYESEQDVLEDIEKELAKPGK